MIWLSSKSGGLISKLFGSSKRPPVEEVKKNIYGRLLTPEEGCGYSTAENLLINDRIPAKIGMMHTAKSCM